MKNGKIISRRRIPSAHPRIELSIVTYYSDGMKIKGLLAEPTGKSYDHGLLYLRGGIKSVGQVRPARIIQFAVQGLVVFAPFYRGNRGGEGTEDFAGKDRMNAFSAYHLLKNHQRVKKVHIFGFSRGGLMALFTAVRFPDVASVVTWGGVTNLFLTYEERKDLRRMMKRVIGGTPKKYPERYRERTALFYLETIQAPILIIHGKKDRHVSITHAYQLESHLKRLNKQVSTWYFPQYTHYFPPAINRRVIQELTAWMKKQSYTPAYF